MHELVLIEDAVRAVERVARDAGARRIDRICLTISPDSHLLPETVESIFRAIASHTIAAAAELELDFPATRTTPDSPDVVVTSIHVEM
jgi:Zn finger protein HypA/HybF involved in hydrogenase expression